MKLKVLKNYKDLQLERVVEKDEVIEVTEERGKALLNNPNNIVVAIGTSKEFDTTPPLKAESTVKEVEKPLEVEKTPIEQTKPISRSMAKRIDEENEAENKSYAKKRRYKGAK